jgi:1,2-diacylglycerol 3-beta-galactosyltransferase
MLIRRGPRRVLMLMAYTGSGHLRAAEAVTESLHRRYGRAVTVEILDAVGLYGPFPFNRLSEFYPFWINRAVRTWEWGYRLTDGARRAESVLRCFWPLVWPRVKRLLQRHPADVIVSMHPLTNHFVVWALERSSYAIPTVTLVTDPVSVHPFWLSAGVDLCLVGSAEARRKALSCGLTTQQISVTGLPVNPCFVEGMMDKAQARRELGWAPDRPAILLLGGGGGIGRLYPTARAIDEACLGIQLAIIAGRNQRLQMRLDAAGWRLPTRVYGFVNHTRLMPRMMSAADVLVTKAGPGTLHEAFVAGLPLILNDAVPGQEDGNVRLVVERGAGIWAPSPSEAAEAVARWVSAAHGQLGRFAACSRALARPGAANAVAEHIWQMALTNL